MNDTGHIVKSFDDELKSLTNKIAQMGGLAESQLAQSIVAVVDRDSQVATRVVENDVRIDQFEDEINHDAVKMLALRQPMARDLREIVAAIKISSDIERIGDLSKNNARRAISISSMSTNPVGPSLNRLAREVQAMIKQVLDSYIERDPTKAMVVWASDTEVDALHTGIFREILTYMMEDPRNITACTHYLFIAKNIERIGDHATNIAEEVHFLVTGRHIDANRPKMDGSADTNESDVGNK